MRQDGDTHSFEHFHSGIVYLRGSIGSKASIDAVKREEHLEIHRLLAQRVPSLSLVTGNLDGGVSPGFREAGAVDGTFGVFNTLMDGRRFLDGEVGHGVRLTWMDLSNGPVVIESAPNTLGIVDDFWFRYVADLVKAGADKGKVAGTRSCQRVERRAPALLRHQFADVRSVRHARLLRHWRSGPAVEDFHKSMRTYPLSDAGKAH